MTQKQILLGVTGGIAAYKSAELVRLLKKAGHAVRVVMTPGAQAFVTPMTFQALSGEAVRTSLLDPEAEAGMGHIELARWADVILVAPASANFIARLTAGMADDLLTTVCCATGAPIVLAPAMNQAMWGNGRTRRNVQALADDPQVSLWGPDEGDQACGDTGPGRMLEPAVLAGRLQQMAGATGAQGPTLQAASAGSLRGQRIVITAGPTREAIDPVRYISNHSSGKMGYAIAAAAQSAGAYVHLISGPVVLECPPGVEREWVTTAEDMLAASERAVDAGCDIFIATAAVADYRPAELAADKLKKSSAEMTLSLTRNPDTLASVAARPDKPFTVGFAAETSHVEDYARDKLARKNLDMIVANDVSRTGLGFNSDDNEVTVYWPSGQQSLDRASKTDIATALLALIADHSCGPIIDSASESIDQPGSKANQP